MKKSKLIYTVCICVGCFFVSHSQITNNYRRLIDLDPTVDSKKKSNIKIDLDIQKGNPPSKKTTRRTIFDLTDKGQKALIEAFDNPALSPKKLIEAIREPLDKSSSSNSNSIIVENFKFYIKLDFNIQDEWVKENPANRISSLKLFFDLKDGPFKIKGFKGFQTQYETIALGTVSNTSTRNFSLTAGTGISSSDTTNAFNDTGLQTNSSVNGLTPSVSTTFGTSNSRTENLNLTRRIISQTGTTSEDKMIVYLEGAPDRNLNGIVTIELELEAKEIARSRLPICNFSIKDSKPKLTPRFLYYANVSSTVKGEYGYEWVYRKIRKRRGQNSNIEAKHVISYYSDDSKKNKIDVLETKDINIPYFGIQYNAKAKPSDADNYQNIYLIKGEESHLANFLSRSDAIRFRWYLLDSKGDTVDGFNLGYLEDDGQGKRTFKKITNADFIKLRTSDRSTLKDYIAILKLQQPKTQAQPQNNNQNPKNNKTPKSKNKKGTQNKGGQ